MDTVKIVELRHTVLFIAKSLKLSPEATIEFLLSELCKQTTSKDIKFGLILPVSRNKSSVRHLKKLITAYDNVGRPREIMVWT